MQGLYRAEAGKFLFSCAGFAAVFVGVRPLHAPAFFGAYIVLYVVNGVLLSRLRGVTGLREQPVSGAGAGVTAANARQSVFGVDATFRWRPLQQGLYKSLLVRAEAMRQENAGSPRLPRGSQVQYEGPTRAFTGWYAFGRWQMGRRWYLGARLDGLEDPDWNGRTTHAASGYWEFFPSEFSKLLAGCERVRPPAGVEATTRLIVQAAFALGPHRPHPF